MKDDRKRVALDGDYAMALGLATFCFARCEWDAVWCCERLRANYIKTIEPKRKTAGVIANDLIHLVAQIADPQSLAICQGPAIEFQRLVKERNGLLHGKPGTAPNGDQRLFRGPSEWAIDIVDNFSDEVTACQVLLNDMVHKHLITS